MTSSPTERVHPRSVDLHHQPLPVLLRRLQAPDGDPPRAMGHALPHLEPLAAAFAAALRDGALCSTSVPGSPAASGRWTRQSFPPPSASRPRACARSADTLWARHRDRPPDLLVTVAAFMVEGICASYLRLVLPRRMLECVRGSGGGSRNPVLLDGLRAALAPVPVWPCTELGMPEAAKGAACFALLGHGCVMGTAQNVPSATGAHRPVVLGRVCLT